MPKPRSAMKARSVVLAAALALLVAVVPAAQAAPSTLTKAKRTSSWRTEITPGPHTT